MVSSAVSSPAAKSTVAGILKMASLLITVTGTEAASVVTFLRASTVRLRSSSVPICMVAEALSYTKYTPMQFSTFSLSGS